VYDRLSRETNPRGKKKGGGGGGEKVEGRWKGGSKRKEKKRGGGGGGRRKGRGAYERRVSENRYLWNGVSQAVMFNDFVKRLEKELNLSSVMFEKTFRFNPRYEWVRDFVVQQHHLTTHQCI